MGLKARGKQWKGHDVQKREWELGSTRGRGGPLGCVVALGAAI